ncbi:MAG: IclR family transcriptional regulator [Desulfobacterales bacterium]|nr:IclR family transcriptional regulator [Desulfobacterales bacterium]
MKQRKTNPSGRRLIQSVQRAGDILALFISDRKSLGITDFARELSLPKTTIQGIATTLLEMNYLEKDPATGKYRLGPMLFQLGMKYAANMDLVAAARGWMERLYFQFNEPVNVGMLVGSKVVIVMRVESDNRFMVFPRVGSAIPAHTTCIGKILFAFMPEKRRAAFLDGRPLDALTPNSITDRAAFEDELARVRSEGVSFDQEENIKGLAGVGGPIFDHTGQTAAAFAITGNAANITRRRAEMVKAVQYTGAMVSSQLGFKSPMGD